MRASVEWLKELSGVDASVEEIAARFTEVGLEVEEQIPVVAPAGVVVAKVLGKRKHPERDKLNLVTVDHGEGELEIICGAPNVPEPGGHVLLAKLGAKLPLEDGSFLELAERSIGGIPSVGMICSEKELGIGAGTEGIFILEEEGLKAAPGTPAGEALGVGDTILEIGLTPNRPDCLGHVGLARELAALFGKTFALPEPGVAPLYAEGVEAVFPSGEARTTLALATAQEVVLEDIEELGPVAVTIDDAERCPRYAAAVVSGVTVKRSPFWLRHRLFNLGVRAISNLVDVTNLVMLEWGHPIHGFDLAKVHRDEAGQRRIDVRLAREGETMQTLDEVERALVPDDLLICDGEGPVGLAGVMGGGNSEIDDGTHDVLIECAYFDPRSIRRTSRRVGLRTDASHRFERGVDPEAVPHVLARATALMSLLGGGVALTDALDVRAAAIPTREIRIAYARLDLLLGVHVPPAEARGVLERLGCDVVSDSAEALEVVVPSWRPDLARPEDLVEEVGRVWGYDKVPTRVPRVRPSRRGTPERLLFERALRETAAAAGLHEAINLAFTSPETLAKLRVPAASVKLANPLSSERSVMRTSLLPGLAEAAARSLRHQARAAALFEHGRTFSASGDVLPNETPTLAMFCVGRVDGDWIGGERALDVYDLKGYVEAILVSLLGQRPELVPLTDDAPPSLHPRRSARVFVGNTPVGVLGELHPDVGDELGFDGARGVYAELDVESLFSVFESRGTPTAPPLPRFPAVTRDVALLVDSTHPADELMRSLQSGGGALVESVRLFDLYTGQGVAEGQRSLAFRLTYRDPEATLTDKRVDKAHRAALDAVAREFGAVAR